MFKDFNSDRIFILQEQNNYKDQFLLNEAFETNGKKNGCQLGEKKKKSSYIFYN